MKTKKIYDRVMQKLYGNFLKQRKSKTIQKTLDDRKCKWTKANRTEIQKIAISAKDTFKLQ